MKDALKQEEDEKLEKKTRYQNHLKAMKEHGSIPKSNYLAKTGVAIIKNNPEPLVDKF